MNEEYIKKLEKTNRALEIENARLDDENDKLRKELKNAENGLTGSSKSSAWTPPGGVPVAGKNGVSGFRNGKMYI